MPAIGSTWKSGSWVPQWKASSWANAVVPPPPPPPPSTTTSQVIALEKGFYDLQLRNPGDVFMMTYDVLPYWVALNTGNVTVPDQRARVLSAYHGVWVIEGYKRVRLP